MWYDIKNIVNIALLLSPSVVGRRLSYRRVQGVEDSMGLIKNHLRDLEKCI